MNQHRVRIGGWKRKQQGEQKIRQVKNCDLAFSRDRKTAVNQRGPEWQSPLRKGIVQKAGPGIMLLPMVIDQRRCFYKKKFRIKTDYGETKCHGPSPIFPKPSLNIFFSDHGTIS